MKSKGISDHSGEVLLSRDQLAERWGCCKETIKRMQRKGELLAIVFSGKNIRYSLADIEQLEQERKHRKYAMAGRKSHA
jgi:predicted site-specific integrase-resolvase